MAASDHALEDAARLPARAQRDRLLMGLVTHQAHPLVKLGRLEGARDLLLRHLDWVEALKDSRLAGPFFLALAGAYGLLGEAAAAAVWLRRAALEAARSGDATMLAMASHGLALDCFWAGRFGEGIGDGRAAVARLRKPRERWWTGQAMWGIGMNSIAAENLKGAIEVEEAAWEAARETGDPRLECFTGFAKGWAHALLKDGEAGIAAGRRAVELAPDPLATAVAQAWLGAACLEIEGPEQAASVLVQAYDKFLRWKCRPLHALVCAWLSNALLGHGHEERALELAEEGLALSDELGVPFVGALARRALGRIARAKGALAEAEDHLEGAHQAFQSIGAAYEGARTLLELAAIANASSRPDAAPTHLTAAQRAFSDLEVPFHATHAAKLADNLQGVGQASLELDNGG